MNKTISVLLAAVLLLSFAACGKAIVKEELIGTWEVQSVKLEDGDALIGSTLTFDKNDHYEWKLMGFTIMEGTYRISGTYVYLDDEKEIFTLDGDTLTVKDASGEMTLTRK